MATQTAFPTRQRLSHDELLNHMANDVGRSLCERPGETSEQETGRYWATVEMVKAFQPRDLIETMLAGHCVTFHAVMIDTAHDVLLCQEDRLRRAARSQLIGMNTAFLGNFDRLARYREGVSEARREWVKEPPVEAPVETASADPAPVPAPVMNRAARRQMARAAQRTGRPQAAVARQVKTPAVAQTVPAVAQAPAAPRIGPVPLPAPHGGPAAVPTVARAAALTVNS